MTCSLLRLRDYKATATTALLDCLDYHNLNDWISYFMTATALLHWRTLVLWLLQALSSWFSSVPWHFGVSVVLETDQLGMDTTWPVLLCLSISHWFQRMIFTYCRKKLPQWDVRAGLPWGAWVETWGLTNMSVLGSCFKASFLISVLRLLFYD